MVEEQSWRLRYLQLGYLHPCAAPFRNGLVDELGFSLKVHKILHIIEGLEADSFVSSIVEPRVRTSVKSWPYLHTMVVRRDWSGLAGDTDYTIILWGWHIVVCKGARGWDILIFGVQVALRVSDLGVVAEVEIIRHPPAESSRVDLVDPDELDSWALGEVEDGSWGGADKLGVAAVWFVLPSHPSAVAQQELQLRVIVVVIVTPSSYKNDVGFSLLEGTVNQVDCALVW